MTTTTAPVEVTSAVRQLGENARLARVRRRLSQEELAQACGITRKTLYAFEKGATGTTLGTAFTVLWKLGLLDTAAALADPATGRTEAAVGAAGLAAAGRVSAVGEAVAGIVDAVVADLTGARLATRVARQATVDDEQTSVAAGASAVTHRRADADQRDADIGRAAVVEARLG